MVKIIDTNTDGIDDYLYEKFGGTTFENLGLKEGDTVIFEGYYLSDDGEIHNHWKFTPGDAYDVIVHPDRGCLSIRDDEGDPPSQNYGFCLSLVSNDDPNTPTT